MTPLSRKLSLSMTEKIFNGRLSHARKIIECAFGVLVGKWKLFEKPLGLKLNSTEKIIMAAVLVHNFLITDELNIPNNENNYTVESDEESDDDEENLSNDYAPPEDAKSIRQLLKQYFGSRSGSLSWQYDKL